MEGRGGQGGGKCRENDGREGGAGPERGGENRGKGEGSTVL